MHWKMVLLKVPYNSDIWKKKKVKIFTVFSQKMTLTTIESLSHTRKVKVRSEKNKQTNTHMHLSSFISYDLKQKYKASPILDLKKKNVSHSSRS